MNTSIINLLMTMPIVKSLFLTGIACATVGNLSPTYSQSLQESYHNQQNEASSRREMCKRKSEYYKSIGYNTSVHILFVKDGEIYSFDSYKCEYYLGEGEFTRVGTLNKQQQSGGVGRPPSVVEWTIENGELCKYEKYISSAVDYGTERSCWSK